MYKKIVGCALAALMLQGAARPAAPDLELQNGVKAYQLGQFVPAAHHFYKVLQQRPDDTTALAWYASALLRAGERDRSLQVYQHIIKLAPKGKAADLARQAIKQIAGTPPELLAGNLLPVRQPDMQLATTYGQILQGLKSLGGYHTQLLALERGVIAAPDSIQALKSLLSLAFNPREGSITVVGVGQGQDEKKSLGAATIDATRWLGVVADWQLGKITTTYADGKHFSGLARVVAKEKLGNGWSVVAMTARLGQKEEKPSPAVTPPAIPPLSSGP